MSTLCIAQVHADTPPAGWPDPAKVCHQIEVGSLKKNPNGTIKLDTITPSMEDPGRTLFRVCKQIDAVLAVDPAARVYLDWEPGERWMRTDVQQFTIDLMLKVQEKYPALGFWLFPGGPFLKLVEASREAAHEVAQAAPLGISFPCYHGNANIESHLRVYRNRLEVLRLSGLTFSLAVCRTYNGASGTSIEGTPVPMADFLAGVAMCREYAGLIMVWGPGEWKPRGELEVRTVHRAGDEDLAVLAAGVA